MALSANELFASNSVDPTLRVDATTIMPKKFAAGSGTIAVLSPVAFNTSTNDWVLWSAATLESSTITANATPNTGGTFTLSVNGETTAAIAFDATAADIQAALLLLSNVEPGDVSAAATTGVDLGDASAVVTLTWQGNFAGTAPVVSLNDGSLTGGSGDHALAEATAGVASNGADVIRGFLHPDALTLAAAEEVLGQVMLEGTIHYEDIPLPAGETVADLKAALRSGLRERGIHVQGLTEVR